MVLSWSSTFVSWYICPGTPSFELLTVDYGAARNGELKCSDVSGTEAISLHSRLLDQHNFLFGLSVPETPLQIFLGTNGYFRADEPNRTVFRQRPRLMFWPETDSFRYIGPRIPVGTTEYMAWIFGYGESEGEVRFGVAPRN